MIISDQFREIWNSGVSSPNNPRIQYVLVIARNLVNICNFRNNFTRNNKLCHFWLSTSAHMQKQKKSAVFQIFFF